MTADFFRSEPGRIAARHGGLVVGSYVIDALRNENFHRDIDLAFPTPEGVHAFGAWIRAHGGQFHRQNARFCAGSWEGQDFDVALGGQWVRPFAQIYLVALDERGPRFRDPVAAARHGYRQLDLVLEDVANKVCRWLPGAQIDCYLDKVAKYARRGWDFSSAPRQWRQFAESWSTTSRTADSIEKEDSQAPPSSQGP